MVIVKEDDATQVVLNILPYNTPFGVILEGVFYLTRGVYRNTPTPGKTTQAYSVCPGCKYYLSPSFIPERPFQPKDAISSFTFCDFLVS